MTFITTVFIWTGALCWFSVLVVALAFFAERHFWRTTYRREESGEVVQFPTHHEKGSDRIA